MSAEHTFILTFEPNNPDWLISLCGPLDNHIEQLERYLGVAVESCDNGFQISGPSPAVKQAITLLSHLYREIGKGVPLTADYMHLSLQEANLEQLVEQDSYNKGEANGKAIDNTTDVILTLKKQIKLRGPRQQAYVKAIRTHSVNFAIGPAGTGKTYLAVAVAVAAFENHQIKRIVLVRPAVEAGEKLGFLPGDLTQKVDPYFRPLYDALFEMMGAERVNKLVEQRQIEIIPLAYMRGLTLSNACVILDEAQNTTVEQMKMFLTRMGFGSMVVITGDVTQTDLPGGQISGLKNAIQVLKDTAGISLTEFLTQDIIRHPMVRRIIRAYDRYEQSIAGMTTKKHDT